MLEIRVHHLLGFREATISEKLRNDFINYFYSEEQCQKIINFLQSLTDFTQIKIVTGVDSFCNICPCKSEDCEFPDSIWDAKEFMYKIIPNEIVNIDYLKNNINYINALLERYLIGRK